LSVALISLTLASGNGLEIGWAQAACTVTVNVGQSIQRAVDSVSEGAVVCLGAGTFHEKVAITRSLTLRGLSRDQTRIAGAEVQSQDPLVSIASANDITVLLDSFTITESKGDGISVGGKAEAVIQNSQISRNGHNGLGVGGSATVTVDNSQFSDNGFDGLSVVDSATLNLGHSQVSGSTQGLFAGDASQARVEGSEILNNFTGFEVDGSAQVILSQSQVADSGGFGLELGAMSQVNLINSQVSDSRIGLALEDKATVEFADSTIKDQTSCGVWVFSQEARVRGTPQLQGHGADLCGFTPATARKPLVPQTDKTQLTVPGDFANLQEAVDALAPGGTILVQTGSYEAGLTIWKPLTLRGAGISQTTLQAAPKREVVISIIAEAQNVALEGLTVTGAADFGAFISSISSLLIYSPAALQNVQISDNGDDGLDVRGSAHVLLSNSQITGNKLSGVSAKDSAQLIIQSSQISGSGLNGLNAWGSVAMTVENSQITDNGFEGLLAMDSATISLTNTQISDNALSGVAALDSVRLIIQHSQISGNGQSGLTVGRGLFGDSAQVTIQSSQISGNGGDGLSLEASARARILSNVIRFNKNYGINAGSTASITTCSGNTVTDNGINYNNAAAQRC
jgi:hypothetical protein